MLKLRLHAENKSQSMPRHLVRIYLASSPDLKEERRLALEVLQELNETKAAERNVVFELVNPDPDPSEPEMGADAQITNSDLFVLMLGKSWEQRSAPIPSETASLEWKFRVAQSAFGHNGRPRLLIYFHSVLPYMMADPGVQLQRVIEFRDAIETSGKQQFTIYDRPLQWRNMFLSHLSRWLDNPRDDPGYFPPYVFPRRFVHEVGTDPSPARQRAFKYAIQAFDAIEQGRLTRAEEYFSQALDIADDPELLYSFGDYLQRIGSLDRAEKIFQRLLTKSLADEDVDPRYQSLALRNLGVVYARRAANEIVVIGVGSSGRLVAEYLLRKPGWKYVNLRESLTHLPYATSRNTFAHGLATAFRSKDTEPFGQMVSHLYHYSPMPPRVQVLRTLVSNVGGVSTATELTGGGSGFRALGGVRSGQAITEREAAEVAPEAVRVLATHAQQKNPSTLEKISRIYSGYPDIVKTLGPKPLSITLSSMAEREATNPRKVLSMNYVTARPAEAREALHSVDPPEGGGGSAVFYMRDVDLTEQEPPRSLVANSWFEDEDGNPLPLRTSLIVGHSYKYFFAIEKVKRLLLLGASSLFKEPPELARAGTTKVEVEVICPLLITKSMHKVSRRSARYYSGTGIRPHSFPLRAWEPGDYLLTLRVFYIRRLLYRAVVPISVAAEALHASLASRDPVSRFDEMLRGDHV